MKKFAIMGLGNFGFSLAQNIAQKGYQVLAIDNNMEKVQSISDIVYKAVEADVTDEEVLTALGIQEYDVGIVSIGTNLQASITATMILKEDLEIPYVITKAQEQLHGRILTKVGADKVVYPEKDMGEKTAQNLISSNVLDYIKFDPDYSVVEIITPPDLSGKTLKEIDLRKKYRINVMAINRNENIILSPDGGDEIYENDILIVMGKNENIEKVRELEETQGRSLLRFN